MTKHLLKILIVWIEYIYDNSLFLIHESDKIILYSHFHVLDIFSPMEQLIVIDFLNHIKVNKSIAIEISQTNNTMFIINTDFNQLKYLLLNNNLLE